MVRTNYHIGYSRGRIVCRRCKQCRDTLVNVPSIAIDEGSGVTENIRSATNITTDVSEPILDSQSDNSEEENDNFSEVDPNEL